MTPGPLILVSGPSGSGKSTLIRRVLAEDRGFGADSPPTQSTPLRLAVSATTRPPRPGEKDGVDYYFWSRERFQEQLAKGAFLEHAVVHGQHYYGTPRSEVDGYRERGVGVILDIDVQGAAQVRPVYPEHLSIFVALSRPGLYEERLRMRGSETAETIARRLETGRRELSQMALYQHVIYNDDLGTAVARFREVLANYLTGPR